MVTTPQSSVRNRLLSALAPESFARLAPHLECVDLPLKTVVVEPDEPFQYLYFLESGLGSVVASSRGEERIEVGHVGREGVTGTSLFLHVDRTPLKTLIQVAGTALRVPVARVSEAIDTDPALRRLMLAYVHCWEIQLAHSALANGRYNVHERLARWLLMCHDRTDGDELLLTHEFLSLMLGVRRSGVTNEMHILEGLKLVRATRGNIRILDRARLEDVAGGSYGLPEQEYERVIGNATKIS